MLGKASVIKTRNQVKEYPFIKNGFFSLMTIIPFANYSTISISSRRWEAPAYLSMMNRV